MFKARGRNARKGQGLVEYVVILVLVSLISVIVVFNLGQNVKNTYKQANDDLTQVQQLSQYKY